jgi:hypothetical protein
MITLNLNQLQHRLQQELPAFHWQCQPVNHTACIAGTDLPEEIHVTATESGCALSKDFYISGSMLMRWGMESSARIICNERSPKFQRTRFDAGADWDKLAEF